MGNFNITSLAFKKSLLLFFQREQNDSPLAMNFPEDGFAGDIHQLSEIEKCPKPV